jgi:hypothetical protein
MRFPDWLLFCESEKIIPRVNISEKEQGNEERRGNGSEREIQANAHTLGSKRSDSTAVQQGRDKVVGYRGGMGEKQISAAVPDTNLAR